MAGVFWMFAAFVHDVPLRLCWIWTTAVGVIPAALESWKT
jgi:hypothetical protein